MIIKDLTANLLGGAYPYKCTYPMTPLGIVWHETDNTASAKNEIAYMQRSGLVIDGNQVTPEKDAEGNISDRAYTSFHWAIDEKYAILGVPMNRNSWQSGDGSSGFGNRKCISIEICKNLCSDLTDYYKARDNCIELTAMLCWKYKLVPSQDTIFRHKDFQHKDCPRVINREGVYPSMVERVKERYKMFEDMQKEIDALQNDLNELNAKIDKRYDTLAQIKKELPWAFPTIDKLVQKKYLQGTNGKLDLTYDLIRSLVIEDRAGIYQ